MIALIIIGMALLCVAGSYLIFIGASMFWLIMGFSGSDDAYWGFVPVVIGIFLWWLAFHLSPFGIIITGG